MFYFNEDIEGGLGGRDLEGGTWWADLEGGTWKADLEGGTWWASDLDGFHVSIFLAKAL
ncbi:hypothetical protein [Paenibacillus lentus]|uniref:hypothetical protein n=1 Tax=Paenibacillus lentus TaxID=1338368 RepID=UPI0013DDECFB|nr:hypothetical protein [Paenibacillus lentus]